MWNLFDKLWGPYVYNEVSQANDILIIVPGQWPDDEAEIEWSVVSTFKRREQGPKWAQRPRLVAHMANWYCADGIRIANGSTFAGKTFRNSVEITDPEDWRYEACEKLEEWVIQQRAMNGLKMPIGKIESAEMSDQGLVVMGQIWDPEAIPDSGLDLGIGPIPVIKYSEQDIQLSEAQFSEKLRDSHGKLIFLGDEGVQIEPKEKTDD